MPGPLLPRRARRRRFELSGLIAHAGFTSGHRFVTGVWDLTVEAGPVHLDLRLGRWWPIPAAALRRRAVIRPLERVLARLLFGVHTVGISPTGVGEWFRADRYRRVIEARATLDGVDLGRLTRFHAPVRFGFTEPPRSPAVVSVAPLLEDRTGQLAVTLDRLATNHHNRPPGGSG